MHLTTTRVRIREVLNAWATATQQGKDSPATPLLCTAAGCGTLRLQTVTTEGQISMDVTIAADVAEPGELLLFAGQMRQAVRGGRDSSLVELQHDGRRGVVRTQEREVQLNLAPAREFAPAADEPQSAFSINCGLLTRLIDEVAFAAATLKPIHLREAIQIRSDGGLLEVAATDEGRIAVARGIGTGAGAGSCTIPWRAIRLVNWLLRAASEDEVAVSTEASRVELVVDRTVEPLRWSPLGRHAESRVAIGQPPSKLATAPAPAAPPARHILRVGRRKVMGDAVNRFLAQDEQTIRRLLQLQAEQPISSRAIAKHLTQAGFPVSVNTVAKYRRAQN
jgi:hypothetical protein